MSVTQLFEPHHLKSDIVTLQRFPFHETMHVGTSDELISRAVRNLPQDQWNPATRNDPYIIAFTQRLRTETEEALHCSEGP